MGECAGIRLLLLRSAGALMLLYLLFLSGKKLGLTFMAFLVFASVILLALIHAPRKKRLPYLIGVSILPFDSLYSSIPILSRFSSSSHFILIILVSILLMSKTDYKIHTSRNYVSVNVIIFISACIPVLISNYNKLPRNIIFIVALITLIICLRNLTRESTNLAKDLGDSLALSIGVYSIAILIFKNPVSLLLEGEYVNKLISNSNPGRLTGFGDDYEVLGLTLAIGAISSYFYLKLTTGIKFFIYMLLFGSICISLLATASITSMVTALVGIGIIEFSDRRKSIESLKHGKSFRYLIISIMITGISLVSYRRLTQRGVTEAFLSDQLTFLRFLNRESVWNVLFISNEWNRKSLFGLGWPYPYEIFNTWPHNTYIGIWITGGVILLSLASIFFIKTSIAVLKHLKFRQSLLATLVSVTLAASFTIDLYRTSSILTLTLILFWAFYKENSLLTMTKSNPNLKVAMQNVPSTYNILGVTT